MSPGVLLRCSASASTGVGHLGRCLAVAEAAAARGWRVHLAGEVTGELALALLAGAPVTRVDAGPDAEGLADAAAACGADVLHVDDYRAPDGLLAACRARGLLLSSTADGPFGDRPADVVVDADWRLEQVAPPGSPPGSPSGPPPGPGEPVRLLGPRHALLRGVAAAARERRRAAPPGPDAPLLVVMGGTDVAGVAAALGAALGAAVPDREVVVVDPGAVGPRAGGAGRDAAPSGRVRVVPPGPALLETAAACALVVTAAGTTTYELAALGAPMAAVAVVDNQEGTYAGLLARGAAVGLGWGDDVLRDPAAAAREVAALVADPARREALAARAGELVDGRGASRLVQAWERRTWRARPAAPEDAGLLRAWRNDPVTRAASGDTREVAPEQHAAWLRGVLADPGRLLWVVEQGATPVGVVRADRLDEAPGEGPGERWELSISLDAAARGRGLSAAVLGTGLRALAAAAGASPVLVARIRPENAASQALFARAGFVLVGDAGGGLRWWERARAR